MKILLLSDVHSGVDMNSPAFGGENYVNTFGSQFAELFSKLNFTNYDLIVNVGDAIANVDHGTDLKAFKKFLSCFKSLTIPVIHVVGNHDPPGLTPAERSDLTNQENNYFSTNIGGFHHLVLDAEKKDIYYEMDERQINWLKEDLAQNNLPVIIYVHYPGDEQDPGKNYYFKNNPEGMLLRQRKELRELLEKDGKVKLVVSGHTHFFHQGEIKGIVYLTVPSFTENDGSGKPCGCYIDLFINEKIKIELKKVSQN